MDSTKREQELKRIGEKNAQLIKDFMPVHTEVTKKVTEYLQTPVKPKNEGK